MVLFVVKSLMGNAGADNVLAIKTGIENVKSLVIQAGIENVLVVTNDDLENLSP